MINEKVLKNEERAVYKLRSLYTNYGYRPYKMSKFEEYDLYVRNKDFLVSDRVITFNDTDGRLLALKPDVTLSIIKNAALGEKHKVYYNENVYRVFNASGQFKEIMQTGLECIGKLDISDIFEVVSLAAESLALVCEDYVLDVSHMGIVSAILSEMDAPSSLRRRVTALISERSLHELERLCGEAGVPPSVAEKLTSLASLYGERGAVLGRLSAICTTDEEREALSELQTLDTLLSMSGIGNRVRYDFSVVNNMNYYNGIVFKGFISGISEGVLAGGSYDNLLRSMRRDGRGIGFALYLDLLAALDTGMDVYDVDVLLYYPEGTSAVTVAERKRALLSQGKSVYSSSEMPSSLKYRELVEIK